MLSAADGPDGTGGDESAVPPSSPIAPHTRPDGRNSRLAAWLTRRLGTMGTVYATVAVSAVWMLLGARQLLGFDPYPYPLLLFVGNLVQLLLIFIIVVGQRVLGAAGDRRAERTYLDAQAILLECHRLQDHIEKQNRLLHAMTTPGAFVEPCDTAPIRVAPPESVEAARPRRHHRLALWLVRRVGSMTAFYGACGFVVAWMVLATLGVLPDPYPFPFLLFLSSLAQLVFMFVIMVGQDVLADASDARASETAQHTQVILRQCHHLEEHLHGQEDLIRRLGASVTVPTPRRLAEDHDHDHAAGP